MRQNLQKNLLKLVLLALMMVSGTVWAQTITITNTSIGGSSVLGGTNYNSGAERVWTQSSVSFGGKAITCNGLNSPSSGNTACQYIQAQASNGLIYNTTALPGRILSVQFTGTASVQSTLYLGSTGRLVNNTGGDYDVDVNSPTTIGTQTNTTYTWTMGANDNYTYFAIKRGSSTQYFSSIVITYATGPTITTGTASNITANSATLNGSITATSAAVTASFNHGPTAGYGSTASAGTAAANATTNISANISSLSPNTQYNFQASGTASSTTYTGSNATFYTLANAPLAPVVANSTTTTLTVALNSNANSNPDATTYAIKVLNASGTTLGYIPLAGGALSGSAVYQAATAWGAGKNVTGLTANTTYTLIAVARNGASVTTDGASTTGTTASCEAPTGQAAFTTASITNTQNTITLPFTVGNGTGRVVIINTVNSFTAPADGSIPSATTAYSGSGQQVVYAATTTSGASVTVTALDPNATYYFAIYEFGCTGTLYNTTPATATVTTCVLPSITSQPSGLTVYVPATATFSVAATGSGTVSYQWQRSTNNGSSWSNISSATSATYTTPATTVAAYNGNQFRAVVTNTCGTGSTASLNSNAVILTVVTPEIALTGNSVAIATGTTATATTNNTLFAGYDLATGQTTTKTFTITNSGTGVLNISNISASTNTGTAFTVSGFTNGAIAANGGTQTFNVVFNASAAGTYTETITIGNDDLDENPYTFVVKATAAVAGAQISVTGNATAVTDNSTATGTSNYTQFADTNVNSTSTRNFTISNQGNENLVISSASVKDITYTTLSSNQLVEGSYTVTGTDSAKFTITSGTFPMTIAPGTTQTIQVTYAASDMAYQFAQLSFVNNVAGTYNPYTYVVKGLGLTPDIAITGNSQAVVSGSTATSSANNTQMGTANAASSGTVVKTFIISNSGNAALTLNTPTKTGDTTQFTATLGATSVAVGGTTTLTVTFAPTSAGFKNAVISIANNDQLGGENPYTFAVQGFGSSYSECATGGGSALIKSQDFEGSSTWTAQTLQNGGGTTTGYTIASASYFGEASGSTVAAIGAKAVHSSNVSSNAFYTFNAVNLSNSPGAKLSFRLGAYSATGGNGLEDGDYVLVQVGTTSLTGNSNFTTKIKINGGDGGSNQNKWSFTSGTKTVSASYNATSVTEFTPSGSGYLTDEGISTVILTDLPTASTFYVRIYALNSGGNEVWAIDDVKIYTDLPEVTNTYSNGAWSGVYTNDGAAPTAANLQKVVIASNYTVTGTLPACELVVNPNITLTVGNGTTTGNLDVQGNITNNGTITVNNNSALIQHNDTATNSGSGSATVIRNSNALYRFDYTLWGSPVTGQQLHDFSPNTATARFYTYAFNWNVATSSNKELYFTESNTNNFTPGKAYLIRTPDFITGTSAAAYTAGTATYTHNGTFNGTLNNGIVPVPTVVTSLNGDGDLSQSGHYIAVANPYPSPISVKEFFAQNSTVIEPGNGIYFWRKKNDALANTYAHLTMLLYTSNGPVGGNPDPNANQYNNGNSSTFNDSWILSPAQGFLVKLKTGLDNTATVNFTNSMRKPAASTQPFFKTANTNDAPAVSRLWINLANANNSAFSQSGIGYLAEGTLGLDYGYDARMLGDGNARLYSREAGANLAIQARPSFTATDIVPMGFVVTAPGQYSISLDHVDGVFSTGQEVYLKDNLAGTVTSLSQNPYTFSTEAGTFDTRFEVIYMPQGELGTETPALANMVVVYQQNGAININTGSAEMTGVTIYDIRGRKLYSKNNINATETSVTGLNIAKEVIIVEISTLQGKVSKKIVF